MSADSEHPEDDLIFDDEEFLLDELDAEQDEFIFGDSDGGEASGGGDIGQVFDPDRPAPQAQSTYSEGEDETLFGDQSVVGEPSETFGSGRDFSEESQADWGGAGMTPDELGIPTDAADDPLASDADQDFDLDAEGQELQLVEHESELDAAETDDADMQYVLQDEEEIEYAEEVEADPEWAPVARGELEMEDEESFAVEDDQDAIYAPEPQPENVEEEEPDYAEYEESYVEAHEGYETAGMQPRRHFRLVSVFSGLAAACLLVAAGAVVIMKPELFGLRVEPELVDVVQIQRPKIDLTLAVPTLDPIPVVPDPVVPDPVVPDPVTPDPVVPDPVVPDPVTPDPVVATPEPTVGPDLGPIQLGETGVAIGEYSEEEVVVEQHPMTIGVTPGSQAFAQLKNGNFFIGKVKTVKAPSNITLSLESGEVTLALADLRTLASLGSDEYLDLQQAEKGFVRLTNNNLLRGTILRYGRDDNVILEMKANQILIPRSAIEEIGDSPDASVHLDDSADSDWVRRLVEEEMIRESGPNPLEESRQQGLETVPVKIDRDR